MAQQTRGTRPGATWPTRATPGRGRLAARCSAGTLDAAQGRRGRWECRHERGRGHHGLYHQQGRRRRGGGWRREREHCRGLSEHDERGRERGGLLLALSSRRGGLAPMSSARVCTLFRRREERPGEPPTQRTRPGRRASQRQREWVPRVAPSTRRTRPGAQQTRRATPGKLLTEHERKLRVRLS